MPTLGEVEEKKAQILVEDIQSVMAEGGLEKFHDMVQQLMQNEWTSLDVAAALLKMQVQKDASNEEVEFSKTQSGGSEEKGGMVRLFINIGRKNRVSPKDVVGALANNSGIPGKMIGTIDIYDNFTFVEVPSHMVNQVVEAMRHNQIKGRNVSIQRAKQK